MTGIAIVSLHSFTVPSLFLRYASGRNLIQGSTTDVCSMIVVGCRCFGPETTAENAAEDEELSTKWGSLFIFGGLGLLQPCVTRVSARKEQLKEGLFTVLCTQCNGLL